MKFERNNKYTTIAIYALLVLIAGIIFNEAFKNLSMVTGFVRQVLGYLQPIVNGVVFAFLLNAPLRFFEEKALGKTKLKPLHKRVVGMLITYVVALTLLSFFIAMVLPQLFTSLNNLFKNLQDYFVTLGDWYDSLLEFVAGLGGGSSLESVLKAIFSQLESSLYDMLARASEYVNTVLMGVLTATQRITTGIINILLGIIVSIYLLFDREKLFAQIKKILRAIFPQRGYTLLLDIGQDANRILSGFVIGKVIDSLIIGVLCFIGMSIFNMIMGMPYALLISVLVGVTNVIPYFGPFMGAVPSAIILAVNNPIHALWFLIFVLALQQFDGNILGPKILGDSIGLSALWVIFSIMFFSGLLGVLGMFIGVPLFAIIYSLAKRFISFLLERKGESTNTRDYDSEKNPLIK